MGEPFESFVTKPIYAGDHVVGEKLICQFCHGPLPYYVKWCFGHNGPNCSWECKYRADAQSGNR